MAAVIRWIAGKLLPTISTLIPSIVRLTTSGSASSSTTTESIQALQQLERRLRRIEALLDDAEEREIQDKSVKLWLKEIKEVAYDADVLDEYQYELLRSRIEGRAAPESAETSSSSSSSSRKRKLGEMEEEQVYGSTSTSCSLLSPIIAKDLVDRINKINEKFDEIAKDRDALCLREIDGPRRKDDCIVPQPTGSLLVDESGIYGREVDRDKIVDLLLSGDEKFTVLPIVGMGGIGKTTLAQLVYNDVRISQFFNLKGWVCVSNNFDVVRLTKAVIESFNKKTCDLTELSALQDIIIEKLKGKKVFLVLDDIWNEKQNLWDLLKAPLVRAEMIKIIMTTRNESVAEIMQTMSPYRLEYLTKEKSWLLFQRYAFADRDPNKEPILLEIGQKITKKCKGLPLAVKVIGGLLRHRKANEESWKDILQSNIWELNEIKDDILPALRLSYHYLPTHLKPCFLYCSLFPKDDEFTEHHVIKLWVAQGYIIQPREIKSTNDVGKEYIKELIRRSLLQSAYETINGCLRMHDLIHNLASSISRKECLQIIVESDADTYDIPSEVRHLHITSRLKIIPRWLFSSLPKALRTFVFKGTKCDAVLNKQFPLKNLSRLRALELYFHWVEGLPESIGTMKHLRYFQVKDYILLSGPEIELPTSVGQLCNLQVLDIWSYRSGRDIWMPRGIGKLTNLVKLSCFNVGRGALWGGIEELKGLVSLRELKIGRMRNVARVEDAREADLQSKQRIEKLELDWGNDEVSDAELEAAVLDSLQPSCTNLRELVMENYGGTRLPSWLGDPSFSHLFSVKLYGIQNCERLPALCQLPSLRELAIGNMEGLKSFGCDLCCPLSAGNAHFPSLESLYFLHLPEWEEWCGVVDGDVLPRLSQLRIHNCPKLRSLTLPRALTAALRELEITECPQLLSLVGLHRTASLERLILDSCPKLRISPYERLPSIPEYVQVEDCPGLLEWCHAHGINDEKGPNMSAEMPHLDAAFTDPQYPHLAREHFYEHEYWYPQPVSSGTMWLMPPESAKDATPSLLPAPIDVDMGRFLQLGPPSHGHSDALISLPTTSNLGLELVTFHRSNNHSDGASMARHHHHTFFKIEPDDGDSPNKESSH